MNTAAAPEWFPSFFVPFFTLSYPTDPPVAPDAFPSSNFYGTGLLDGCLVITCIAVMAALRDAIRLAILEPFARWKLTRDLERTHAKRIDQSNGNGKSNGVAHEKANNVSNGNGHPTSTEFIVSKREARKLHRTVLRFAEQGWPVIYYTALWLYGLYIHRNVPTELLHPRDVWVNYPHIPLAGPLKLYYLIETAFYMHQILVLNAEARRKDHWQMMTHHIITVILMVGSYFYNFTRVGVLVMFLMDLCDIFLPLAKMLRYLSHTTLCDATFVCFMISWLITRHALFVLVIKSAYVDAPRIIPSIWDPARGLFSTKGVLAVFSAMLVSLQIIQIIWFWMVCRVAIRVVTGQGAEDERSDSEL
ncbi:longevity assurance proteins LAG1/LAC1 [Panus rudis PR-1116 ss-1]|nr:longevity assurance proteins LAG1/LAC1 [Panus rudis PR-1116 ss-1]